MSRISKIKESFTKKRLQIHMLAVHETAKLAEDSKNASDRAPLTQLRTMHLGQTTNPSQAVGQRIRGDSPDNFPRLSDQKMRTVQSQSKGATLNSYLKNNKQTLNTQKSSSIRSSTRPEGREATRPQTQGGTRAGRLPQAS